MLPLLGRLGSEQGPVGGGCCVRDDADCDAIWYSYTWLPHSLLSTHSAVLCWRRWPFELETIWCTSWAVPWYKFAPLQHLLWNQAHKQRAQLWPFRFTRVQLAVTFNLYRDWLGSRNDVPMNQIKRLFGWLVCRGLRPANCVAGWRIYVGSWNLRKVPEHVQHPPSMATFEEPARNQRAVSISVRCWNFRICRDSELWLCSEHAMSTRVSE